MKLLLGASLSDDDRVSMLPLSLYHVVQVYGLLAHPPLLCVHVGHCEVIANVKAGCIAWRRAGLRATVLELVPRKIGRSVQSGPGADDSAAPRRFLCQCAMPLLASPCSPLHWPGIDIIAVRGSCGINRRICSWHRNGASIYAERILVPAKARCHPPATMPSLFCPLILHTRVRHDQSILVAQNWP